MIYFNYFKKETYSNILPLGLIPYTKENIDKYLKQNIKINKRSFGVLDDIKCHLSDGQIITIPKGFVTDLMSIPSWAWSLFAPFDSALIGDLIHDFLYVDKLNQINHFKLNIYQAQKFADAERNKWREQISNNIENNNLKFKNWFTNKILTLFAKDFYNKKYIIPD